MQASVLYLQANDRVAMSVKDKFDLNEVEFLIADCAKTAFQILEERVVVLAIIDANIQDMKLLDFITKCHELYPKMIFNVCLDVADGKTVSDISRFPGVKKMFLQPINVAELVDGAMDSLDSARIDMDYEERLNQLKEDEDRFESTLDRLKRSLQRQQYSYNKIEPFFSKIIESFCDITELSDETKDFIKKSNDKLLQLETIASLKVSDYAVILRNVILNATDNSSDIKVIRASSCFAPGTDRHHLAEIAYATWLIAAYEKILGSKGDISIDSRYVTSTKCEFVMTFDNYSSERLADKSSEIQKYLLYTIGNMSDMCDMNIDGSVKRFVIRIAV